MLPPEVLRHLICPLCTSPVDARAGALVCPVGHSFDVARHGYVSLLRGDARGDRGDTAAMVRSRAAFLGAGHFAPLTDAVIDAASRPTGLVVDVGAGTGHHLAALLREAPDAWGLAVDNSKHAARLAARAHGRLGAVVADVWRGLPVATGAAEVVLNVFAPRDGSQFRRVLRPGGRLVTVVPRPDHLAELGAAVGLLRVDDRKTERLQRTLSGFAACGSRHVSWLMNLSRADVVALMSMGPSARHLDAATLAERVARLPDPFPVTASVEVSVFAQTETATG